MIRGRALGGHDGRHALLGFDKARTLWVPAISNRTGFGWCTFMEN
ncbi:MAG TPA: hypothetical protein VKI65_06915 [Gemmataceae bacterium]|nr:hypothetical protein [Gemmataceae bacterium]